MFDQKYVLKVVEKVRIIKGLALFDHNLAKSSFLKVLKR